MRRASDVKKEQMHMAAVDASRAAREFLEPIVSELKSKLTEQHGMSQRDMRKMVSSIDQVKNTMSLAETVSATAAGTYATKIHKRIITERRRANAVHRTPEKDKRKMRLGPLQKHDENLIWFIEGGDSALTNKSTRTKSSSRVSHARLKV